MLKQETFTPQQIAKTQEDYYFYNRVYMDRSRFERGRSSWNLALNNHQLTSQETEQLHFELPSVISDFHASSAFLIEQALAYTNENYRRLFSLLTTGVPDRTLDLWQKFINSGLSQPFSSRPDIIFGRLGTKVIEYNVDGGADKGNTVAVNTALQLALQTRTLGQGLTSLFVDEVRRRNPEKDRIIVATVVPDNYRTEYDPQNYYFARQANIAGKYQGITWIARKLSELQINGPVITVIAGKAEKIDVIDREFKTPGFISDHGFKDEEAILNSILNGEVQLLGTILPLQDKILMGAMFDPRLAMDIASYLGRLDLNAGFKKLHNIRRWHADTHLVDPSTPNIDFSGNQHTWDGLLDGASQEGFVLKRGGDSIDTTASKGVIFSIGRGSQIWKQALEQALEAATSGKSSWVIQKLNPPSPSTVRYMTSSNAPQAKVATVPNRFAPYYVFTQDGPKLGNILVTAGTDREVEKLGSLNIHGQRDNTYQGAEVIND